MTTEQPVARVWSIALCPSGEITEILEGLTPEHYMLPPCSNDDMPEWTHVIEYSALEALQLKYSKAVGALKKLAEPDEEHDVDYCCADDARNTLKEIGE